MTTETQSSEVRGATIAEISRASRAELQDLVRSVLDKTDASDDSRQKLQSVQSSLHELRALLDGVYRELTAGNTETAVAHLERVLAPAQELDNNQGALENLVREISAANSLYNGFCADPNTVSNTLLTESGQLQQWAGAAGELAGLLDELSARARQRASLLDRLSRE